MKIEELNGKRLALIMYRDLGGGERDVRVDWGIVRVKNGQAHLDRLPIHEGFSVPEDWLPRIERVSEKVSDIVAGADYLIKLSVGPAPLQGAKGEDTGIVWEEDAQSSSTYAAFWRAHKRHIYFSWACIPIALVGHIIVLYIYDHFYDSLKDEVSLFYFYLGQPSSPHLF